MIEPADVHSLISRHRTDEVVVTEMTAALVWPTVSNREDLDLCLFDCMGKASSIGLGIALSTRDRKILVLDGDGSLLMNLGSLVTIGGASPSNLIHFVLENGQYEVTGGQPIPGAGRVKFAEIATGAGYRSAYTFSHLDDLERHLDEIFGGDGPTLVCLKVKSTDRAYPIPDRLTSQAVREVSMALSRSVNGTREEVHSRV